MRPPFITNVFHNMILRKTFNVIRLTSYVERLKKTTLYLIKSRKFRKLVTVDFNDDDNRSFIDEDFFIRRQNTFLLNFFTEYIDMRIIDLKRKKNRKSNSKSSNVQKIKLKKL